MNRSVLPVKKASIIELPLSNKNNNTNNEFIPIVNGEAIYDNNDSAPIVIPQNKLISFIKNNESRIATMILFVILCLVAFLIDKFSKSLKIFTVVGVYFGSKNSGYYIIKDSNLSSIYTNINYSEIILDEYGLKGLEYGDKAHNHSKVVLEKEKRLYFYNFKKYLIQNENLEKAIISPDIPKNHNTTLIRVIKEYLDLFKNTIKKNKQLRNLDKKWVVTIPDFWKKKNIDVLKDAVKNIDIDMENIETISESHAVLLGSDIFNQNKINNLYNNKIFMVINADLYNTDINVYKTISNGKNSIELIASKNYPYGYNKINDKILDIVENSFEVKDINKAKDNFDVWKLTLDDIENKIKLVKDNMTDNLEIRADFSLDYYWMYRFKQSYTRKYENYEIKDIKGKVFIPGELVKKIINENILNILSDINNIFNQIRESIDYIIVMGEFSKSNILKNTLIKKFDNIKIQFIDNYEKVIMKGAALYGLEQKY